MIDFEDNLEGAQTRPRPNRLAKKINFGEGVPWGVVIFFCLILHKILCKILHKRFLW